MDNGFFRYAKKYSSYPRCTLCITPLILEVFILKKIFVLFIYIKHENTLIYILYYLDN